MKDLTIYFTIILYFVVFSNASLGAERIEFNEEELAKESVRPVFENNRSVLNRTVKTEGRFELGGGLGMSLNEAFYDPMNYGFTATYHFSEINALNFSGTFWKDGLSSYGKQLQAGEGLEAGGNFNPVYAPHAKSMFLANYQVTVFYGKISISKQAVMNLTLHGLAGVGMIQMDGMSPVTANLGFGQRFFFTKRIALRMDLGLLMYQGPDATSVDLNDMAGGFTPPTASSFEKSLQFQTMLQGYLVFLL